jgi:hypothetical protein
MHGSPLGRHLSATCATAAMSWMYVNPFWHEDRLMSSQLDPDECRRRLKAAPTSRIGIMRIRIARGDFNFAESGARFGSLFEMHVRVVVTQPSASGSVLRLQFSGGLVSGLVFSAVSVGCVGAFLWAATNLLSGSAWSPIYGAALLAILVPPLMVLALRAEAPGARGDLWDFIAEQVDGHPAAP